MAEMVVAVPVTSTGMSIRNMRRLLKAHSIDSSDCVEKRDLQRKVDDLLVSLGPQAEAAFDEVASPTSGGGGGGGGAAGGGGGVLAAAASSPVGREYGSGMGTPASPAGGGAAGGDSFRRASKMVGAAAAQRARTRLAPASPAMTGSRRARMNSIAAKPDARINVTIKKKAGALGVRFGTDTARGQSGGVFVLGFTLLPDGSKGHAHQSRLLRTGDRIRSIGGTEVTGLDMFLALVGRAGTSLKLTLTRKAKSEVGAGGLTQCIEYNVAFAHHPLGLDLSENDNDDRGAMIIQVDLQSGYKNLQSLTQVRLGDLIATINGQNVIDTNFSQVCDLIKGTVGSIRLGMLRPPRAPSLVLMGWLLRPVEVASGGSQRGKGSLRNLFGGGKKKEWQFEREWAELLTEEFRIGDARGSVLGGDDEGKAGATRRKKVVCKGMIVDTAPMQVSLAYLNSTMGCGWKGRGARRRRARVRDSVWITHLDMLLGDRSRVSAGA